MTAVFSVAVSSRRGRPVIELGGECDLSVVPEIRSAVEKVLAGGTANLVFDLEATTHLDSSALGALLASHRRAGGAGGKVTLLCSNARVLRVLKLAEVDRFFEVRTARQWEQSLNQT